MLGDDSMSNLTPASNEASISSSNNRTEIGGALYPQQSLVAPTQPAANKKKRNLPGNPDPEAEVIALSPRSLLATNRFVCEICNKGFQRDQNLQLHRRGHNLPWKLKQRTNKEVKKKVYVCPEPSCVHHHPSRALGDLTGIKKHFCRKHGEKKWKCEKCSKRYAVQSDWKAHSKICGTREYRCDCGTLFSRRDSFITHRAFCDALAEESSSSKFKSFSYLYNEDQFIAALANDVTIVKSLPPILREARRRKEYQHFKPKSSASLKFYTSEVLPRLKKGKVIGLILTDGGCLQSILPPSMAEYQRLRCRVAFHALQFRPEIEALGKLMVERLRASGQPYLSYHPGLKRDALAYHGCAEIFQDVHTELIQYRRAQMIKQGIISEELSVDSHARKRNGSCPLMPEEVGLLLRAMGYPPRTRIYLAGSETFGGQRVMIPLRAMYTNLVDRTSLCSKKELANLVGPETPLTPDPDQPLTVKSANQLKEEWDKAGPRPRPLPPPPGRPIYRHEKEGWYGWIADKDMEPEPSPKDQREQAHRLLWDALDYIVSVDAEVFFPGFDNDGNGPDFASLVMGHRLYEMASARTFRPDRKYLAELFNNTIDHLYYPPRNWTVAVREHLNKSLAEEGLLQGSDISKTKFFLSNPIPECSCSTVKATDIVHSGKNNNLHLLFEGQDECPKWMQQLKTQETNAEEVDSQEDETDLDGQSESEGYNGTDAIPSLEQDEEMDPDD